MQRSIAVLNAVTHVPAPLNEPVLDDLEALLTSLKPVAQR